MLISTIQEIYFIKMLKRLFLLVLLLLSVLSYKNDYMFRCETPPPPQGGFEMDPRRDSKWVLGGISNPPWGGFKTAMF